MLPPVRSIFCCFACLDSMFVSVMGNGRGLVWIGGFFMDINDLDEDQDVHDFAFTEFEAAKPEFGPFISFSFTFDNQWYSVNFSKSRGYLFSGMNQVPCQLSQNA